MLRFILPLALAAAQFAAAQTAPRIIDFNQHLWLSYNGDHKVKGNWGLHFDGHWRRADLGPRWQQLLLRPAVNYALSPTVQASAGYAFIKTYPYGDFPNRTSISEHRLHQQISLTRPVGSIRVQHRARIEQRFTKYVDPQPRRYTYQNRFRYMIRAEAPLATDPSGRVSWYLPAFNEIFIGIAPNYGARPFDQNRTFIGVGKALAHARVEAGYMNQFIGQRNGRIFEFNNTVVVTVSSNVPLSALWGD